MKVVKAQEKKADFILRFLLFCLVVLQVVLENNYSEKIHWCYFMHTHVYRLLC